MYSQFRARPAMILILLITFVYAGLLRYIPIANNTSRLQKSHFEVPSSDLSRRQDPPVNETFYLRICPLGASITNGFRSSDGNGYRKSLRDQLRWNGWAVNMVGSLSSGTMEDNQNEGHYGLRIDQISSQYLSNLITYQPNLVLINLGTNDAIQNYEISTAGQRMIQLLDQLWVYTPGTTVILSTLLPNTDTGTNANVQKINEQYNTTVANHYTG
jgi:lysophospholipase L1-like esterase